MENNNLSNNETKPNVGSSVQNDQKINQKNKGTGMSSEGGSNQTEESWQGVNGGTMSNAQLKSKNQGNGNMSNSENEKTRNKL